MDQRDELRVEDYVDIVRVALIAPDTVVPVSTETFEPHSLTQARAALRLLVSRGWTPPDSEVTPSIDLLEDDVRFQEVLDHLNSPGEYRSS